LADVRDVVLLGSTGSIGTQTLDVVSRYPDRFRVTALSAGGSRIDVLADQVRRFSPALVALPNVAAADALKAELGADSPELFVGPEASTVLAEARCDVVLNAITGAAGLRPTLAALATGTTLALANKESLVIGGRLVTAAAAPGQMVAVDSEHSAFAQALRAGRADEVRRLILTASGGPFRGRTADQLREVTVAQALAHPNWAMGRVITINSATLINKGLELLEAHLLYDVAIDDITVVVHPQSVVHSMVEYVDGSTIAQCSPPDMRLPIGLALTWPERLPGVTPPNSWTDPTSWTFEPLDNDTFPAVELARTAGRAAGTAPAVYNAANEAAVDAFCDGRISFLAITEIVRTVLGEHLATAADLPSIPGAAWISDADLTVDAVLAADTWGRQRAETLTEEEHA
jgi:1-deoxy-D-xylulose-5-phosphate reductoisomerase